VLAEEARWIGRELARIPDDALFPMVNLGSSTGEFRTQRQAHIDGEVFAPLRARGGRVIHVDIKDDEGVDMAGDLTDPAFVAQLRGLGCRSVMVSNLLEHVEDRSIITEGAMGCLDGDGLIIASGPYKYPRHLDPIDTMFRVGPEQAAALFPGMEVVASAVVDAGRYAEWRPSYARPPARLLRRALLPYPRHSEWRRVVPYVPYLVKHAKAFAVILRKSG
jgi:hypothetical protein